jgi:uncharacterized protein YndB with AHSA1/START domain
MTVTAVRKDVESVTMSVDTEFDATPERVWQLWEDPRQLERWWGPPSYPATFDKHEGLIPGAKMGYHMTGPEGDTPASWWEVVEANPPHSLVIRDGFADDKGEPDPDMPITLMNVTIDDIGGGRTRMTIQNTFSSVEGMEQLLGMGMEQGLTEALGQIDAILAETKTGAAA